VRATSHGLALLAVCECIQHNTNMSEVMTIRVDRKTKTRLEKLAKAMERTKSYVAAEAIRAYVELNEWQITEIKAALKEADASDFASEKDVHAVMRKWSRRARKMA
jgi:RHH-type rel operon transcriptional repressor/antitoxin RelB